jgi:predicted PurR-regulated permease PerM
MHIQKIQIGFFISLIVVVLVASFFVVIPYFVPVLLAGIFAVIFYPLYRVILNLLKNRKTISSILSVLIILNIVIVPLMFFTITLFNEFVSIYSTSISGKGLVAIFSQTANTFDSFIAKILPFEINKIQDIIDFDLQIKTLLQWLLNNLSTLLSGLFLGVIDFFVFILGLFYFLRDGDKLQTSILHISPLKDTDDLKIVKKLKNTINSIIRGRLIVAVIQGFVIGIGFLIFNVPNPAVWSFIAAILSFIPGIGPIIILLPVIIYSAFSLGIISTIGLIALAFISVIAIDNTLAPIIMNKGGVEIHPFIILISILGGIKFLGPIGFIVGPMIISLFFTLLEIYPMLLEKKIIV